MDSIYDFTVKSINGKEVSLSDYREKIVLIVNTASKCGFTTQYQGLEELYNKYKSKGFAILGFPCNQFGFQEPGDDKSIQEGCLVNYGVSFPMFSKIKVNGPKTEPLYQFLKEKQKGGLIKAIKWNFTKFIIDKNGIPVHRFSPSTTPKELESFIEDLL